MAVAPDDCTAFEFEIDDEGFPFSGTRVLTTGVPSDPCGNFLRVSGDFANLIFPSLIGSGGNVVTWVNQFRGWIRVGTLPSSAVNIFDTTANIQGVGRGGGVELETDGTVRAVINNELSVAAAVGSMVVGTWYFVTMRYSCQYVTIFGRLVGPNPPPNECLPAGAARVIETIETVVTLQQQFTGAIQTGTSTFSQEISSGNPHNATANQVRSGVGGVVDFDSLIQCNQDGSTGPLNVIIPSGAPCPGTNSQPATQDLLDGTVAGKTLCIPSPPEIDFDGGDALSGKTVGLVWFELTDGGGTLQLGSTIPLADPVSYFGGFKEKRVLTWARVQRALSDVAGRTEGGRFGFTLVDTDRKWRGILGTEATRALRGRSVVLRSIDDESRRLQLTPRTIARGLVQGYQPRAPFLFDFFCEDEFTQKLTTIAADPRQVPKRRITSAVFNDLPVENNDLPVPIIYGRSSDYAGVVNAAGVTGVTAKGVADAVAALTGFTATAVSGGNSAAGLTRFYIVTALGPGPLFSENRLSAVVSATTTASLNRISLAWDAAPVGTTAILLTSSSQPDFFSGYDRSREGFLGPNAIALDPGATSFINDPIPPANFAELDFRAPSTSLAVVYFVFALLSDGSFSKAGRADIQANLDGQDISITEKSFSPYGSLAQRREAVINWSAFTGAEGYKIIQWVRFRGGTANGVFINEFDVDKNTFQFQHVFDVFNGLLLHPTDDPIIPPGFAGGAGVSTNELRGVVPTIHVGTEEIAGNKWNRLLLCGHAVKDIQAVFKASAEGASFEEVPDSDFGTAAGKTWLSPFKPGWPFVDDFRDISGRRYTLIYTLENPVPAVTLVNVFGIETVGDGSGTLIESVYEQYLHFIQNWVLRDYTIGDYLGTPTFSDDANLPQIDDASFTTAKEISERRISGGYLGAVAFGAEGEFITVLDALSRWNLSGDVDAGFNAKFQYFVSLFEATTLAGVPVHDDVVDIFDGSFVVQELFDSHFNIVPFAFARDYRLGQFFDRDRNVQSARSIAAYGQELLSPIVELFMVRDSAIATDIAGRRLQRFQNPPRLVSYRLGLQGLSVELGDLLKVTHEQGISSTGWLRQPIRIVRHEVDPNDFSITLQAWDVFDLFQACFILGDETVQAASFVGASVEDQRFGYLADDTTEEFSDGTAGKRLC